MQAGLLGERLTETLRWNAGTLGNYLVSVCGID